MLTNCLALLFPVLVLGADQEPQEASPVQDSCITCHQSEEFLVTNKKLYDYFQDWRASVHGQEDITCVDCHGGNSKAKKKEDAHGAFMTAEKTGSAVNFENIPNTCGQCHSDKLESYVKSEHFQHLPRIEGTAQGPNCVTCHGSLNSRKLDVNTVAKVCEQCHNAKTENHPTIPYDATALLNDFNTLNGYRRFISRRSKGDESRLFIRNLDRNLDELSTTWHLFNLDKIEEATSQLMTLTREKRDSLLKDKPEQKQE